MSNQYTHPDPVAPVSMTREESNLDTPQQKIQFLIDYQTWRRGGKGKQPAPADVGNVIDWAINVCYASVETLEENNHLVDGEQCTLKALRVAVEGKL